MFHREALFNDVPEEIKNNYWKWYLWRNSKEAKHEKAIFIEWCRIISNSPHIKYIDDNGGCE